MSKCLSLCSVATLFLSIGSPAADKDDGKAAGILLEKNAKWLLVRIDGNDEPVKFMIGDSPDKKLSESLKSTFDACRVELTYKKDGDAKQVITVKRQILKEKGMFTGTVVKVHNDFWVEVKPKTGLADALPPAATSRTRSSWIG